MKRFYGDHMYLMCKKGIYPYEWVDNFDKMDYVGIPPIEAFRSSLKQETASKEDYDHVINVNVTLKCSNWKEYTVDDFKCDVLLLADVLQKFQTHVYELL